MKLCIPFSVAPPAERNGTHWRQNTFCIRTTVCNLQVDLMITYITISFT